MYQVADLDSLAGGTKSLKDDHHRYLQFFALSLQQRQLWFQPVHPFLVLTFSKLFSSD